MKSATSHKTRPPIPLCSERSATISVLGMCVIYQLQLEHTGLLVAAVLTLALRTRLALYHKHLASDMLV